MPAPSETRFASRTQRAREFIKRQDDSLNVDEIIAQVITASSGLQKHQEAMIELEPIPADTLKSLVTILFGEIAGSVSIATGKAENGKTKITVKKF